MKHSVEIYFVQFSMSLLFVFQHFKNKIRHESGADSAATTSPPPSHTPAEIAAQWSST